MTFAQNIPGVSQFEQIAHHDSEHVPVSILMYLFFSADKIWPKKPRHFPYANISDDIAFLSPAA
jgi:hypothetical protein